MSFMQRQITPQQPWWEVETTSGTFFVDKSLCGIRGVNDYVEGKVLSVSHTVGYGARLSAPGYMDCTEWCVFSTPEEAKNYLDEMYDNADEEEDYN